MPFCGPSEPPSGKGTQGSRAGGQAGTQWEAASWGEGWRKRRLKQNSFTDELTFMELPSVSRSGLKLQRMSRSYLMELSTHVTSELWSERGNSEKAP